MISTITRNLRAMLNCQSGNALTLAAFTMPVLIGGAGLGVDMAQWYLWNRELQFAVDQAAIAGAYARGDADTEETFAARASQEFAANIAVTEWFAGTPSVSLADYDGGAQNSVVVNVAATRELPFSSLFMDDGLTVRTAAQALFEKVTHYGPCLLALHPSDSQAFLIEGDVTIEADCGIGALSTHADAIQKDGGSGRIDVEYILTAGGLNDPHGSMDHISQVTGSEGLVDPYEGLVPPNNPTARSLPRDCTGGSGATFSALPGTYRLFSIPCNVNLAPGVYVINGGSLSVEGGKRLSGSGVMFVLKNGADVRVAGGAQTDLTGMSVDQLVAAGVSPVQAERMAGMLIFEDPASRGSTNNEITGNSNSVFNGIIYLPKSRLRMSGTPRGSDSCMVVASRYLTFSGTVDLNNLCPAGTSPDHTQTLSTPTIRLVA